MNLVQLVVLTAGFVWIVPVALDSVGGFNGLTMAAGEAGYTDIWQGGGPALYYMALLVPPFIISPGLVQKVYGARDERTVRIAVGAAGLALMVFAFLPVLLGMVARVHFPELSTQALALPTLLVREMPLALGCLGLAAIFSAEVSSADAVLFMLATSLSRDLYRRFVRPDASDADVLRVARGAALVGGLLGVVLAIAFETIIGGSHRVLFVSERAVLRPRHRRALYAPSWSSRGFRRRWPRHPGFDRRRRDDFRPGVWCVEPRR